MSSQIQLRSWSKRGRKHVTPTPPHPSHVRLPLLCSTPMLLHSSTIAQKSHGDCCTAQCLSLGYRTIFGYDSVWYRSPSACQIESHLRLSLSLAFCTKPATVSQAEGGTATTPPQAGRFRRVARFRRCRRFRQIPTADCTLGI